ncbi:MAG: hypothetical protein J6C87_01035 [Bacteroides sp.]|nr:hypothetical protein [Bacteroides sp.]
MKNYFTSLLASLLICTSFAACSSDESNEPTTSDVFSLIVKLKESTLLYHNGQEYYYPKSADVVCSEIYNGVFYCITRINYRYTLHTIQGAKIEQQELSAGEKHYEYDLYQGKVYKVVGDNGKCTFFAGETELNSFETSGGIEIFHVDKQTGDLYAVGKVYAQSTSEPSTITVWKNGEVLYEQPAWTKIENDLDKNSKNNFSITHFTTENGNWYLTLNYLQLLNPADGATISNLFAPQNMIYSIKNGVQQSFFAESENAYANYSTASNGKLYWAGYLNNAPCLWINGTAQTLEAEGSYRFVAIHEGNIYVTGNTSDCRPLLTLNGKKLSHPFLDAIKEEVYNVQMAFPY